MSRSLNVQPQVKKPLKRYGQKSGENTKIQDLGSGLNWLKMRFNSWLLCTR